MSQHAWEQPGLTAEARARAIYAATVMPDEALGRALRGTVEQHVSILTSAIRAAEASAVARERERCVGVARGAAKAGPAVAVVAEHIATRINQGEK